MAAWTDAGDDPPSLSELQIEAQKMFPGCAMVAITHADFLAMVGGASA